MYKRFMPKRFSNITRFFNKYVVPSSDILLITSVFSYDFCDIELFSKYVCFNSKLITFELNCCSRNFNLYIVSFDSYKDTEVGEELVKHYRRGADDEVI